MDIETAVEKLEYEWDKIETGGFFEQLGKGLFDENSFNRLWDILSEMQIPDGEMLDRRFVEVVWFMPTFMHWQQEGWRMDGKDTQRLEEATRMIEQRLTTIFGLP